LLANPLRPAIDGGRERYIIVIDALDEAGDTEINPLVKMLAANIARLPNWLGIVVTSRPESAVKSPLQEWNPEVLDTRTEANRADLRDYLQQKLASQLTDRPDAHSLVELILEKSEGVFLYVERFCEDVQQNHLSLDRPEQFPQGLGGIFCQWFQRQFPDLEKFRKDVRPALRAILAAREPLPVEILQRLFDWQDEELRDFTRTLGSLFPVTNEATGEAIKPYHKSLTDWLTEDSKARNYFISSAEGQLALVKLGIESYRRGVGLLPEYFVRNLPAHLHTVRYYEQLYLLLRDTAYTTSLGIRGYESLPAKVRRWASWKLQREILEGGWVGEWCYVEFDADPNTSRFSTVWRVCHECLSWIDGPQPDLCPRCGWRGDKDERKAFDKLEAQYGKLNA
ncbi:MAG: hypothetical protein IT366_09240, partial [Candidatus Hydrogenedentes bacterium]|nr:hypothetical protein [Candidatus Hydrogenedentota bacterium]